MSKVTGFVQKWQDRVHIFWYPNPTVAMNQIKKIKKIKKALKNLGIAIMNPLSFIVGENV